MIAPDEVESSETRFGQYAFISHCQNELGEV